ncbi:MAG: glycosyltransferase [Deltaproteobacteria bacterium]|nr:glycosyltransferase [Deltaproteobacteria bacterium]
MSAGPCLSVVVPVLDEAAAAPRLVRDLGRQEGLRLELVAVDGGSRDRTPELLAAAAAEAGLPLRFLRSAPGRAVQLNAGAREAGASDLLFLHADSELVEKDLLRDARERMEAERAARGSERVAGHFALCFRSGAAATPLACYLLEARSRLTRRGFVTGDQGLWLSRRYFRELGGFDESLPLFEDCRLLDGVFETGAPIRLPGVLVTSARRFEAEGFGARLLVNALLRGCEAAGLTELLRGGAAYRPQGRTGALDPGAFCRQIQSALASRGLRAALRALSLAGAFAAGEAWQLAFLLDCLRGRLRGSRPEDVAGPWLGRLSAAPNRKARLPPAVRPALGALAFYGSWLLAAAAFRLPRPARVDAAGN